MRIGRANLSPTALLAIVIVLGEWSGLARALLTVPAYAAVLDLVLVALTIVTLIGAWQRRASLHLRALDVAMAAFFVLALLEVLNPNVPSVMVGLEGLRKTSFTMLAYIVVRFSSQTNGISFYRTVAIGSIAALAWSIRQAFGPLPVELDIINTSGASPISFHSGPVLRAFAPTSGPFHLGILGGAVALIAVVLARALSLRYLLIAILAATALGISLTRANMVGAVVAFAVVTIVSAPTLERIRTGLRFAPVVAALGLAVVLTARSVFPTDAPLEPDGFPGSDAGQSGSLVNPDPLPNPLEDRSLRFRFQYWTEHLEAIAERPLIGYGTSSAADSFARLYAGTGDRNFDPHSLYLKTALELGLLGFLLMIAILVLGLWECRRAYRRERAVALIGLGIVVMTVISGATGPMLDAYPFNLLFWATLGWLVAVQAPAPDRDSTTHEAIE